MYKKDFIYLVLCFFISSCSYHRKPTYTKKSPTIEKTEVTAEQTVSTLLNSLEFETGFKLSQVKSLSDIFAPELTVTTMGLRGITLEKGIESFLKYRLLFQKNKETAHYATALDFQLYKISILKNHKTIDDNAWDQTPFRSIITLLESMEPSEAKDLKIDLIKRSYTLFLFLNIFYDTDPAVVEEKYKTAINNLSQARDTLENSLDSNNDEIAKLSDYIERLEDSKEAYLERYL